MNILMVLEIVVGIVVLTAVVRFAVRDARERDSAGLEQRGSEPEAERQPSEVPDRA